METEASFLCPFYVFMNARRVLVSGIPPSAARKPYHLEEGGHAA